MRKWLSWWQLWVQPKIHDGSFAACLLPEGHHYAPFAVTATLAPACHVSGAGIDGHRTEAVVMDEMVQEVIWVVLGLTCSPAADCHVHQCLIVLDSAAGHSPCPAPLLPTTSGGLSVVQWAG